MKHVFHVILGNVKVTMIWTKFVNMFNNVNVPAIISRVYGVNFKWFTVDLSCFYGVNPSISNIVIFIE